MMLGLIREDKKVLADFLARLILPIAVATTFSHFSSKVHWIYVVTLALLIPLTLHRSISYFQEMFVERKKVENSREFTLWISFEAFATFAGIIYLVYWFAGELVRV